ncbi:T9SS type A sorting domain-containing protein [Candidatus Nomurabacteria bacterium]|nr:T9SS type A sorting domain-containing protein [Candidatus Nomurabacteria bacterium]
MKKTTFFNLILIVVSSVLFSTTSLYAQTPAPSWSSCLGGVGRDEFWSVCPVGTGANNKNVLMAGFSTSSGLNTYDTLDTLGNGAGDAILHKKDNDGNDVFLNNYGGIQGEMFYKAVELADKGYLAIGVTFSPFPGFHGGTDVFVVKTDSSGNEIWKKVYGGTGGEEARDVCVIGDTAFLFGATNSNNFDFPGNHGDIDAFILKIRVSSGAFISSELFGGTSIDRFQSGCVLSNGNLVGSGLTNSTDGDLVTAGGHPNSSGWVYDMFTLCASQNLDIQWAKCVGSNTGGEHVSSMVVINDHIFIAGTCGPWEDGDVTHTLGGTYDAALAKLDTADGNLHWFKTFGGSLNEYDPIVKESVSGNLFFGFSSESSDSQLTVNNGLYDESVFLLDLNGGIQWTNTFGGAEDDWLRDILPGDMDDYITVGSTRGSHPGYLGGFMDALLVGSYFPFQRQSMLVATNLVNNELTKLINIYPNPTLDKIRITLPPETTNNTVTIYNLSGQVLFSERTSEVIYITDLAQFAQGTYVVEVKNSKGVFRDRVQKL